jgi:Pvc16 N-terminal domain
MFDDLDKTLEQLLAEPTLELALPQLFRSELRFDTPEKGFVPRQDSALNLFLYQVGENRELRDPEPWSERRDGMYARRRAPLRVDCSYLVTAWTKAQAKISTEHLLLAQALNWVSRFPTIPTTYLYGTLAPVAGQPARQPFPLPVMVAQVEAAKNFGEFWHALEIAPRAYFTLVVTIAMDLDLSTADPMVTTLTSQYRPIGASSADERIILGGTVRDAASNPVPNAWVRLEPAGLTQVADRHGRFIFTGVTRASGLTLRARAPHLGEAVRTPVEIPSSTRDYDLHFIT